MDYDDYNRLYERIEAYRAAVHRQASEWIRQNAPEFPVDNTVSDPEAYNIDLGERIGAKDGHFRVWLIHNSVEAKTRRISVPAELLTVPGLDPS
ncbi:hypothetical protein [Arthrobacter caoxuetaonis]|uniref:Uncharacterized protein n=1 Tax=Arthrobacter caoxuetaonis TaxID=2886935 RepID=A0A9X1MGJ5_9MICC|nr:hypothetical protein [Arthrobacter caoxuetaonis]MCC3299421.1 hypothetical protein [Arthrobacter caoxuetaonis]USQ59086.1 hypothetical protein NF551_18445 [Arthrobacter caoxuetaonis]